MSVSLKSRVLGAVWGNCVADALGGPVQFKEPGTFRPIADMEFVQPFGEPAGSYSDDGSMTLALTQSLIDAGNRYDHALAIRYFLDWWVSGRFSTTDVAWDVGISTGEALSCWKRGLADIESTQQIINKKLMRESCSGNGSLMRIAPVGVAFFHKPVYAHQVAEWQSQTTHPARACVEACQVYTNVICGAMLGETKEELCARVSSYTFMHSALNERLAPYTSIAAWKSKTDSEMKSSGWVIDTLECALWAFFKYNTWSDGALAVVNRGGDSDTAGAIYGALAGVFYGVESIPWRWVSKMQNADMIRDIAEKFSERVLSEHESLGR